MTWLTLVLYFYSLWIYLVPSGVCTWVAGLDTRLKFRSWTLLPVISSMESPLISLSISLCIFLYVCFPLSVSLSVFLPLCFSCVIVIYVYLMSLVAPRTFSVLQ